MGSVQIIEQMPKFVGASAVGRDASEAIDIWRRLVGVD